MNNHTILEIEDSSGKLVKHIIIDRGNNEFTSMPKSVWDELEAAKENDTLS